METLAVIAAGLGVLASIVYMLLWLKGIKTLQEIRDALSKD